ncbi:enterochelin esterase domain-containing protein [Microbacterium marinilacus]|uniref:Esterase family protein n=1 Tax=Microbacterium marinilacus TaxID=415209 RepID=A0ABP7BZI2_9MICO|nr:enterochelin esterase domain-containing protein [Microbacterium marinilacus]MBY0688067.1 DUF3327 domain-containing protein [Microbacterium marinilacus]
MTDDATTTDTARQPELPGDDRPVDTWRDRLGREHAESRPTRRGGEPVWERVAGPLETAWSVPADRAKLAEEALSRPNPLVATDADGAVWTWVVPEPDARAVLLWLNADFPHDDVAAAELTRLAGSDLWTISLRLPAELRTSYRIAAWRDADDPPWRRATGRRPVILAAMGAAGLDPRGADVVGGSRGETSSVAAGPAAPAEPWREGPRHRPAASRVEPLELGAGERAWTIVPEHHAGPTRLLVLFDGQVWLDGVGLPALLDEAVARRHVEPLHVVLLDSHDTDTRWDRLGVPGGQVDVVLDRILPAARARYDVDPRGEATIVAGQSLGGIAAAWTIALAQGEVQHAIAQSPSLWRFDVAEALLAEPAWRSLSLSAGSREGHMLDDARALEARLRADPRLASRSVHLAALTAGHDWASWRADLLSALAGLPPHEQVPNRPYGTP